MNESSFQQLPRSQPFSFYDELSVFACFISRVTLKRAQSPQEMRQPLRNRGNETVLQLYPELIDSILSEVTCWILASAGMTTLRNLVLPTPADCAGLRIAS